VRRSRGSVDRLGKSLGSGRRAHNSAYPGFRAAANAAGEYNGKFMVGQMVLRGGASVNACPSFAATYRHFYRPEQRWMFFGRRLARDLEAVRRVE